MSKTIEITVGPNGQTRVETKGFAGSECQQASRFVEQALGEVHSERLTSEFWQVRHSSDNELRQGNGS